MPRDKFQRPMEAGASYGHPPNKPAAIIVGSGAHTYLWIGNDAPGDTMCFATISGAKLRQLAREITRRMTDA